MIPIVLSTDHRFLMPTGVTMLSILRSSIECEIDFYILCDDSILEDDKNKLRAVICESDNNSKVNFIHMGDVFANSYEDRGVTYPAYYRLLIPWIIKDYEKVIYCDGDVIFKKSIKSLYDYDLGDNYCAGVKRFLLDHYSYRRYAKNLGINPEEYINSGVLLINSREMRNHNVKDLFLREAQKKYHYFDQDIINIVCKGKIATLPFGYNVTPTMDISDKDIIAIHYAGLKPWMYYVRRWYDWWNVYCHSPFYDENLEKDIVDRPLPIKQSLKVIIKRKFPTIYNYLRDHVLT